MIGTLNYYEDGVITILLSLDARKPKEICRKQLAGYLSYPQTTQLHIYCITEETNEEVVALIRFAKSLYNIPIFCYYDNNQKVGEVFSY